MLLSLYLIFFFYIGYISVDRAHDPRQSPGVHQWRDIDVHALSAVGVGLGSPQIVHPHTENVGVRVQGCRCLSVTRSLMIFYSIIRV